MTCPPSRRGAFALSAVKALLVAAVLLATSAQAIDFDDGRRSDMPPETGRAAAAFETVGQLQCIDPARPALTHIATAWLIGAADTVITAAHSFFPDGRETGVASEQLEPSTCTFVLFGADHRVRAIAHIRYAVSPWARPALRHDSAFDVAVIKLDRALRVGQLAMARIPAVRANQPVRLMSFRALADGRTQPAIATGDVTAFPRDQLRWTGEMRITDAGRLFVSSASSTAGSSGGMYFAEGSDAAIGIHIGNICEPAALPTHFDAKLCFNFGLRFDADLLATIDAVVRDRPRASEMLGQVAPRKLQYSLR